MLDISYTRAFSTTFHCHPRKIAHLAKVLWVLALVSPAVIFNFVAMLVHSLVVDTSSNETSYGSNKVPCSDVSQPRSVPWGYVRCVLLNCDRPRCSAIKYRCIRFPALVDLSGIQPSSRTPAWFSRFLAFSGFLALGGSLVMKIVFLALVPPHFESMYSGLDSSGRTVDSEGRDSKIDLWEAAWLSE